MKPLTPEDLVRRAFRGWMAELGAAVVGGSGDDARSNGEQLIFYLADVVREAVAASRAASRAAFVGMLMSYERLLLSRMPGLAESTCMAGVAVCQKLREAVEAAP